MARVDESEGGEGRECACCGEFDGCAGLQRMMWGTKGKSDTSGRQYKGSNGAVVTEEDRLAGYLSGGAVDEDEVKSATTRVCVGACMSW